MRTPEFKGTTTGQDGWEFDGWKPTVSDTVKENATYTAKWKQTKFTVAYDLNGGTINAESNNVVYPSVSKGASTPTPTTDPVKFSHTFLGWKSSADGKTYTSAQLAATTVTGDVVYTAQWEPINYVLNIKANAITKTYDGTYYGGGLENAIEQIPGTNTGSGQLAVKVVAQDNRVFYVTGYATTIEDSSAVAGKVKDAGEYAVKVQADPSNVVVYNEDGTVYDGPRTINTVDGTLEIAQREITVAANGGSKPYDGTPLTAQEKGYTISSGTLAAGQTADVALTGDRTLVGTADAVVSSVAVKDATGADVTKNYKVTPQNGTLTVTNRAEDAKFQITLVASSSTGNT